MNTHNSVFKYYRTLHTIWILNWLTTKWDVRALVVHDLDHHHQFIDHRRIYKKYITNTTSTTSVGCSRQSLQTSPVILHHNRLVLHRLPANRLWGDTAMSDAKNVMIAVKNRRNREKRAYICLCPRHITPDPQGFRLVHVCLRVRRPLLPVDHWYQIFLLFRSACPFPV